MSVRDTVQKRKPKVVAVPLSGGDKVWVKSLSGAERGEFRSMVDKAKANGGIKAEVIAAMALCEEDGGRVYDFHKEEDLQEVRDMDGADVDQITMVFLDASGLSEKSVEQLQKNSEATPND